MFVGQNRLWTQVDFMVPRILQGTCLNVLFQAPSGWGKTKMAIEMAILSHAQEDIQYELPDSNGDIYLDPSKRCYVLDEIHGIRTPELLYPMMDSGRYTFLLCTNESGELKEPLRNRCIHLIFDDYSLEEITEIVYLTFEKGLNRSLCEEIARNSQNNPRIAKMLSKQLGFLFEQNKPESVQQVRDTIENILQIRNGLNPEQQRYLEFLRKVDRASLDLITSVLHLDKKSVQRDIEPYLVRSGLISITSRGRKYGCNL